MPGVRRTKAVVRTDTGWHAFNFSDGIETIHPSGYRRDTRVELIIEDADYPDEDRLEDELKGFLTLPLPDKVSP